MAVLRMGTVVQAKVSCSVLGHRGQLLTRLLSVHNVALRSPVLEVAVSSLDQNVGYTHLRVYVVLLSPSRQMLGLYNAVGQRFPNFYLCDPKVANGM
jgi:hypothetical protein